MKHIGNTLTTYKPGSFSKNFGWEDGFRGLAKLHAAIRYCFSNSAYPVSRDEFRTKFVSEFGSDGQALIALNFFLFNRVSNGRSEVVADELVFRAIAEPWGPNFDALALNALHLSRVGHFDNARDGQDSPALWAKSLVTDKVVIKGSWLVDPPSTDFIERHFSEVLEADTTRKFATNLHRLYQIAQSPSAGHPTTSAWWNSAVFLALDRLTFSGILEENVDVDDAIRMLFDDDFHLVTGVSGEYPVAYFHAVNDYYSLGGVHRFEAGNNPSSRPLSQPELYAPFIDEQSESPVTRQQILVSAQKRDRRLPLFIKLLYGHTCAACGQILFIGPARPYSELAHIRPVGAPHEGLDGVSNAILLCPNHHKVFDYGGIAFSRERSRYSIVAAFDTDEFDKRWFEPHERHALDPVNFEYHRSKIFLGD